MTKVLKNINENKIMIGFVLLTLFLTIYMGMNERRLDNIKSSENSSIIIDMK